MILGLKNCSIVTQPDGSTAVRGTSKSTVNSGVMGDLKDPRLIYLKAALFLVIGVLSVAGLLLENFSFRRALLLLLAIWSFCRLYYFCFYVIEKYIDADYKFAGLFSVVTYLWRRRKA